MRSGWDVQPRTFNPETVAGPARNLSTVTHGEGTGIIPSGSAVVGTASVVHHAPILPVLTAGVAHSNDNMQQQPQPTIVDPSDQDSTDEDESVPQPLEAPEKEVKAFVISSDSEPFTGSIPTPPPQKEEGFGSAGMVGVFAYTMENFGLLICLALQRRVRRCPRSVLRSECHPGMSPKNKRTQVIPRLFQLRLRSVI